MDKKTESLAKVCKELMLKEPFYGLFLIMLNKSWSKKVPTAAVSINDINYRLEINEEFWEKCNPLQKMGLLKHELLHIGFFHLTNFNHLSDQRILNLAMDCEINQYIDRDWLPGNPVLPECFPDLNLGPKEGTISYYEKMMTAAKNNSSPNLKAALEGQGTIQIVMAGNEPGEMDIPQHDWEEVELDEATQKLIEKQTGHILNELADQVKKSRGTIPGEFQSILDKINHTEPPKFDWKGFLRRFSGASVKVYTKKSRRKLSKRYEENPGLKIKQKKHVLVAVDTSGSVSNDELIEFFQEINHIHKTGTDITVVQADTHIRDISPFDPKKEIKLHGRGGTSFDPVVEYYSENVHKYTCLIYLTDGEAPAPEYSRGRMLWVHSSCSSINESLPGIKIQLN